MFRIGIGTSHSAPLYMARYVGWALRVPCPRFPGYCWSGLVGPGWWRGLIGGDAWQLLAFRFHPPRGSPLAVWRAHRPLPLTTLHKGRRFPAAASTSGSSAPLTCSSVVVLDSWSSPVVPFRRSFLLITAVLACIIRQPFILFSGGSLYDSTGAARRLVKRDCVNHGNGTVRARRRQAWSSL